ncbi:MAG: polyphosphate kinase 2 family protein [Akkermansiaceae bacterium]
MPVQGALEKYLVQPNEKVKLSQRETNDKSLFDGEKEDHYPFLDQLRDDLRLLQNRLYAEDKRRLLVVIQAMDTGGKDGTVKSVFSRVDPQGIHVEPFKKPSSEELAHDFLWRVHSKVPRNGQIVVFNRSHYEDIIAVRVKEIYPKSVWKPRYQHIIDFEKMLADEGTTIVKLFLHISKDEQKERLQARLDNPAKNWKFNPDDLKDRARWDDFQKVYEDVIEKTSTEHAPWYVIPADRKWYRNLVVSRILVDTLDSLGMEFPLVDWMAEDIKID